MDKQTLDQQLIQAHAAGDRHALVALYTQAAAHTTHETANRFYLTHAYIFALETDHPDADALKQSLIDLGCEE